MTGPHPEDIGDGRLVWPHGDGTWSISEDGVWLPGLYASRDAAVAAFDHPVAWLAGLVDQIGRDPDPGRRTITVAMLGGATRISRLIEASSLGTPDAVAMRARTTNEQARRVVQRAQELSGEEL